METNVSEAATKGKIKAKRSLPTLVHTIQDKSSPKSMHTSMKFVILMAQIFSLMPIEGASAPQPNNLRFTWKSPKMIYTAISLLGSIFMVSMGIVHIYLRGFDLSPAVQLTFFSSGLCTIILFAKLAKDWPKLMMAWTRTDSIMEKNYGYPQGLDLRLKITAGIIMTLAMVEHVFSVIFHGIRARKYGEVLNLEEYYMRCFPQVFLHLSYSHVLAAIVQAISILDTFTWTYSNLFIILVSSVLAIRFRQITQRLMSENQSAKMKLTEYWVEIREDYDRLSNLCKELDECLSLIILLSYATNLFFILIQLFYSLRPLDDMKEKIYFFYSFGFLIFRTVAVSLYAAWINDESKGQANILNSVSADVYNNEIRRFLMQISFDNVALTGSKMFKITRGLILNVAGAIVTYELVLIQFNGNSLQTEDN